MWKAVLGRIQGGSVNNGVQSVRPYPVLGVASLGMEATMEAHMTSEPKAGETGDESGAPLNELPPARPSKPEPKDQKPDKPTTGDPDSTQNRG